MLNNRNWSNVSLGEIAKIERTAIPPQQIKTGTTYVGLENIDSDGKFVNVRAVESGDIASAKFTFNSRHILFGKLRPYLKKIARPTFDGVCSTDILPILPSSNVDRGYLYHCLRQQQIIDLATARSAGANLPRISPAILAEFPIPLPPLAEQRRIAEILDRADALREKRRKSIAMINELRQSVFETFAQTRDMDKSTITLGEIAEDTRGAFVNGPFGSDLLTSELQSFGVPVIYIRDIRNGEYNRVSESHVSFEKADQLEICAVKSGDVLVAKVGDPPGIAAIYPATEPDGIITQDVIRIRINRKIATPEFLASYLNSPVGRWKIKKITVEATRARFSLRDFKQLQFEIPSINKQIQFSKIYHSLDNLISKHRSSQNKLDELFHSLQHRAFNGNLIDTKNETKSRES